VVIRKFFKLREIKTFMANKVSLIAFLEGNKILLQERKDFSRFGEEWAFFGGQIENGETPEQALKREIREELDFSLEDFKFFKKYVNKMKEGHITEKIVFIAKFPGFDKIKLKEGSGMKLFTFDEAKKLKLMPHDIEIIEDLSNKIRT